MESKLRTTRFECIDMFSKKQLNACRNFFGFVVSGLTNCRKSKSPECPGQCQLKEAKSRNNRSHMLHFSWIVSFPKSKSLLKEKQKIECPDVKQLCLNECSVLLLLGNVHRDGFHQLRLVCGRLHTDRVLDHLFLSISRGGFL